MNIVANMYVDYGASAANDSQTSIGVAFIYVDLYVSHLDLLCVLLPYIFILGVGPQAKALAMLSQTLETSQAKE